MALSVFIIILALVAHLVAIFLGFRFHRWMLDHHGSSQTPKLFSWFRHGQQSDNENNNSNFCGDDTAFCGDDTTSVGVSSDMSNSQIAFLQTLAVWLLVACLVGRWGIMFFLPILVGLIFLLQKYPAGTVPDSHLYIAIFGYLAWLAVLATTYALLLWPIQAALFGDGGGFGFLRAVSIGGALSFSMLAALALIAFCVHQPQVARDTGNFIESRFAAMA